MAKNLATTRMSSKGQVVIPEVIRKKLGLKEGVQFIVIGSGDAVILKTIASPSANTFNKLLAKARASARRMKLQRKAVSAALKRVRGRRGRGSDG